MAKPGPAKGITLAPSHREKIAKSQILSRLISFAEGKPGIEMEPHRVTAALGLLRKVLPDMTENMIKGDENAPIYVVSPRDKLKELLDRSAQSG